MATITLAPVKRPLLLAAPDVRRVIAARWNLAVIAVPDLEAVHTTMIDGVKIWP